MASNQMRSPFGRATGLGWPNKASRVTAIALIPLMLWFLASIIAHSSGDYAAFVAWLKMPLATCMMILLLIAFFYHTALGLQVIIEDYVHSTIKIPARIAMRLACFGFLTVGIVMVVRIVFGR